MIGEVPVIELTMQYGEVRVSVKVSLHVLLFLLSLLQ
jgi:hypothetical protein